MAATDNDPITLADAASHFKVSKGVLMADGKRGKLEMFLLGKTYYTTPNAIREWVSQCRVAPKARGYISIEHTDGQSEMARISNVQAAALEMLSGPRSS
jgi:hypothetical protein